MEYYKKQARAHYKMAWAYLAAALPTSIYTPVGAEFIPWTFLFMAIVNTVYCELFLKKSKA